MFCPGSHLCSLLLFSFSRDFFLDKHISLSDCKRSSFSAVNSDIVREDIDVICK